MSASARGLFRATGKASKPVSVRMFDGSYDKAEHLERETDDFYPTPPEPIRALLKAERARLSDFSRIWEPACGDGAMVEEIDRAGFHCVYSDIIDRGCNAEIKSFYDFKAAKSPCIITNPPYQECNARDGKGRWIWHALKTLEVDYMALLLNWSWPSAGGHACLWQEFPPARVYLMRWKIDFTGQGAPPMLNGWFVWDNQHRGPTSLLMLDRHMDAAQLDLIEAAE